EPSQTNPSTFPPGEVPCGARPLGSMCRASLRPAQHHESGQTRRIPSPSSNAPSIADNFLESRSCYPTFSRIPLSSLSASPVRSRRYGRGAVEVIVVVGLLGFFLMWFLIWLPQGRETSRMAACQKNLMQIGLGLQLY